MGMFTVISQDAFEELQVDAGVILNQFDPANPTAPDDEDIVTATTGGITVSCTPTYSDYFADVDNAPNNTKEGKHLDGWDCRMSTTALGVTAETIRLSLGAATVTSSNTYALTDDTQIEAGKTYYTRSGTSPNYTYTAVTTPSAASLSTYYELVSSSGAIVPNGSVSSSNFEDLWWVGDKADGGMVAVQLKNALSTGGFSLKTTKNGKGQLTLDLTGHVSISSQNVMPMAFYVSSGS